MASKEIGLIREVVREVVEDVMGQEKSEILGTLDKIVRSQETFTQEMTLLNGAVRRSLRTGRYPVTPFPPVTGNSITNSVPRPNSDCAWMLPL